MYYWIMASFIDWFFWMIGIDFVLLMICVTVGVFVTGWFTPLIIVLINRLLVVEISPFVILVLCMVAGAIGNVFLWYFDKEIHYLLDKKLKLKKHDHLFAKKKGPIRKISHKMWEKIQFIENKYILFWAVMCASFSFIPDFFIVEFSRSKLKLSVFIFAMFFGKLIVYAPLIWGSIGFLEIIKFVRN